MLGNLRLKAEEDEARYIAPIHDTHDISRVLPAVSCMVRRMVMYGHAYGDGYRGVWAYIGDGLEPLGFGMLVSLLRQRVSISYQVKGMLSELHSLAQTARTQGVSTRSENLCAMMACSMPCRRPLDQRCGWTIAQNETDSSA